MNTLLHDHFCKLLHRYSPDPALSETLWKEIHIMYGHPSRHYHNLNHLVSMYANLLPVSNRLSNADAVWFAMYYHDIIYSTTRRDNEEKSAILAGKRLHSISFPDRDIQHCQTLIRATQHHTLSTDPDINYFIDADLAILGTSPEQYIRYTEQIRREYRIYPDIIYKPGRRKVIQHFLEMPGIYKTSFFKEQFEKQAMDNLHNELETLNH